MKKKILLLIISTLILFTLFSRSLDAPRDIAPTLPSSTHSQPGTTPPVGQDDPNYLIHLFPRYPLAINFYSNPILIDRNYQLKNDDSVCVGDTINIRSGISGEWFSKGGAVDSPPIVFVTEDDFKKIVTQITQNYIEVKTSGKMFSTGSSIEKSDPKITGISLDIYFTPNGRPAEGNFYASVFCTGDVEISEPFSDTDSFIVQKEGSTDVELNTLPSCACYVRWDAGVPPSPLTSQAIFMHYLYPLNSKILNKVSDPVQDFKMTSLAATFHFNAVAQSQGANLQIIDKSSSEQTIMLTIQNTGDATAFLDDVTSSISFSITRKPSSIKPGEADVVYLQSPGQVDLSSLTFQLSYRSETLGCQESLQATTTQLPVQTISCTSNSQCSTNLCCAGQCRDASKGSCVDIDGDGIPDWVSHS